jgi:hypothetical protein
MQSPPRYTPCNGLMYETDLGNYVSYLDYLALKGNLNSILTECRKLTEENKKLIELREGDFHLTKSLAEALDIKITASDKSRGAQWEQFHDGCLALFKDRNDLKWAWDHDTDLIKSLAKTLGIEITAPDTDTVMQWEEFTQGCLKLKEEMYKVGEIGIEGMEKLAKRRDELIKEINRLTEAHTKDRQWYEDRIKENNLTYIKQLDKLKLEHQKEIESFAKIPFECDIENTQDPHIENMSCPGVKVKVQYNNTSNFQYELECLINKYSLENHSNTPDFILAQFLCDNLAAWNKNLSRRESWYGRQSNSTKNPE